MNKWTITIEPHVDGGFCYDVKGRLADGAYQCLAGFEPTREQLASILAKTVNQYFPPTQWDKP